MAAMQEQLLSCTCGLSTLLPGLLNILLFKALSSLQEELSRH